MSSVPSAIQQPERSAVSVRALLLGFDPGLRSPCSASRVCSLIVVGTATADDVAGRSELLRQPPGRLLPRGRRRGVLLWRFDYSRLRELKYVLYGVLIGSLLAVMALGSVARGSRRAIDLPFFSFQASEIVQGPADRHRSPASRSIASRRGVSDRRTTARIMLLGLIPAALVMAQPDLGSALVLVVITLSVLFFAGAPWRHFAALAALGLAAIAIALVALPAAGVNVLHDYQKERLTAFLHPSDTSSDEGYQQNQSRIAIGAGEKTGRGDRATQTKLNFLPEHHTDFMFAVVGERWGFAGAALVLSLYALLIWRGLRILTISKNLFGVLIAGGIVAMMLFQVFVNVGMTVGIVPITGDPVAADELRRVVDASRRCSHGPAAVDLCAGPLGGGVEGAVLITFQ